MRGAAPKAVTGGVTSLKIMSMWLIKVCLLAVLDICYSEC